MNPCPYPKCGRKPVVSAETDDGTSQYQVHCICGAHGPYEYTAEDAEAAWDSLSLPQISEEGIAQILKAMPICESEGCTEPATREDLNMTMGCDNDEHVSGDDVEGPEDLAWAGLVRLLKFHLTLSSADKVALGSQTKG